MKVLGGYRLDPLGCATPPLRLVMLTACMRTWAKISLRILGPPWHLESHALVKWGFELLALPCRSWYPCEYCLLLLSDLVQFQFFSSVHLVPNLWASIAHVKFSLSLLAVSPADSSGRKPVICCKGELVLTRSNRVGGLVAIVLC